MGVDELVVDRVIQQTISQVLQPLYKPQFSPFSFGLRSRIIDWDGWLRRRIRMCIWKSWKRVRTRYKNLQKLIPDENRVRMASHPIVHEALLKSGSEKPALDFSRILLPSSDILVTFVLCNPLNQVDADE